MAQLELNDPYGPAGPDSSRELERKLNNNYAELCALAGVSFTPVRLSYSSTNGGLDTARQLEVKLNGMAAAIAAATGTPAPEPLKLSVGSAQATYFSPAPSPLEQQFTPVGALSNRAVRRLQATLATLGQAVGGGPPPAFSVLPTLATVQVGLPLTFTLGSPPPGFSITLVELVDANNVVLASGAP